MDVNEKNQEMEINLSDVLYLLKRKLVGIILFAILGGLAVGLYTYFRIAPTYEASSKVYIVSSNDTIIKLSDLQMGTTLAADYIQILKTRPVLAEVQKSLKEEIPDFDMSVGALSGAISIKNPADTRILVITVTTTRREWTDDIANKMAEVAKSELQRVMDTSKTPQIIEPAVEPSGAVGPNYVRNIVIGAVVMAVLYFAFCFIQFILDDTLKSEADIERYFGITPLAVIPEYKDLDKTEPEQTASKQEKTSENAGGQA